MEIITFHLKKELQEQGGCTISREGGRKEVGAGACLQDQAEPSQPQQWGQPVPAVCTLWLKQLQMSFSKGLSPQIEKPRVMEFHRCCFENDFIPHSVEGWKVAHAMNPKRLKHSWGSDTRLTHLSTERHHSHCPKSNVFSSSIRRYLPTICLVLQLLPRVTSCTLVSKREHSVVEGGERVLRLRKLLQLHNSGNLESTRLGSPSTRLSEQSSLQSPEHGDSSRSSTWSWAGRLCESSPRLGLHCLCS